jgi:hypothetical protein
MLKFAPVALATLFLSTSALAQVKPFPATFKTQEIATNGATIHVRVGGTGPAVVLLHGYGETGDMWEPLAADLAAITPSSFPTCAAWDCRPSPPPAAMTRRPKAVTWPGCSTP